MTTALVATALAVVVGVFVRWRRRKRPAPGDIGPTRKGVIDDLRAMRERRWKQ